MTIRKIVEENFVADWKEHLKKRGVNFRSPEERMDYILKYVRKYMRNLGIRADQLIPTSWGLPVKLADTLEEQVEQLRDFETCAIKEFEYCAKCRKGNRLKDCHSEGHKNVIREVDGYYYVDPVPVTCNFWREEKAKAKAYQHEPQEQKTRKFV